jgi:hypothetical protein
MAKTGKTQSNKILIQIRQLKPAIIYLTRETTQVTSEAQEPGGRAAREDRPQHANKQHFRPPSLKIR